MQRPGDHVSVYVRVFFSVCLGQCNARSLIVFFCGNNIFLYEEPLATALSVVCQTKGGDTNEYISL